MPNPVYRTATFLCQLVARLPIGTNLGLVHLLWTLLAGHLLPSRGAVMPALQHAGVSDKEARQAEAALREGKWAIQPLLRRFGWLLRKEQHAQRVNIAGLRAPFSLIGSVFSVLGWVTVRASIMIARRARHFLPLSSA